MSLVALTYQKNSYVTSVESSVLTCEENLVKGKGKQKQMLYRITLHDSVLFPMGGGQPSDKGTINGLEVHQVNNEKGEIANYVSEPLKVGDKVKVELDWSRRFDHMQQHSGQHVFSAIAEKEPFKYNTVSWSLGENVCTVDLDSKSIPMTELLKIEHLVNKAIRDRVEVVVHFYSDQGQMKTRGLPDNIKYPIRMIEMKNIDENLCCGTHVSNLADIQMFKVISATNIKNLTRVTFLCGERASKYFTTMTQREQALTGALCVGPVDHVDKVKTVQKTQATLNRQCVALQKELANLEALNEINNMNEKGVVLKLREGVDMTYMTSFLYTIQNLEKSKQPKLVVLALTNNDQGDKQGTYVIWSSVGDISKEMSSDISGFFDGKGGGKGCRVQGKGKLITANAIQLVSDYINTLDMAPIDLQQ